MDEILQELIKFVKTASPVIWQTLYKQAYMEALGYFLWAIGLAVLAVILFRLAKWAAAKAKKEEGGYKSDWETLCCLFYLFAGIAGIIAFGLLVSAIKLVANPEFYVIRYILETLGGG